MPLRRTVIGRTGSGQANLCVPAPEVTTAMADSNNNNDLGFKGINGEVELGGTGFRFVCAVER